MPRQRLHDMEIDEVSLVDRPANQHASVAIAKRDSGETMPNYQYADGTPVETEEELEHGDFIYDADSGEEFQITEVDDGDDYEDYSQAEEAEASLVDKADWKTRGAMAAGGLTRAGEFAQKHPTGTILGGEAAVAGAGGAADYRAGKRRAQAGKPVRGFRSGFNSAGYRKGQLQSGMSKSLGQEVLEELSKAYTGAEANQVVSKIADLVDAQAQELNVAQSRINALIEKNDREAFSKAVDDFGLPVSSDELGGIFQRMQYAGVDPADMDALGDLLAQAGQMSKALEEVGEAGGYSAGSVLGEVEGYAKSLIGKSDGGSLEGAMVDIFSANPAAYDAYLTEQG
jgi:hypothetical protein